MKESIGEQLGRLMNIEKGQQKGIVKEHPVKESSFEIGKIITMPLDESDGIVLIDGYTHRKKFFVILGQSLNDSVIGALLINSKINKNVINEKVLLDCQFPLKQKDYPSILKYDSYLDCSDLFEISRIKILQKGSEADQLTESDRHLVIDHVEKSEVIKPKQKKKFGIEDKS